MNIFKRIKRRFFPKKLLLDDSPEKEIDLRKVNLDTQTFLDIKNLCENHYDENPGCHMSPHWQESFKNDLNAINETKKLAALNWVGSGFPYRTDLRSKYKDIYGFSDKIGNMGTLDMQTAMHQFYSLDEYFKSKGIDFSKLDSIRIIEVGGGYGRLAIFFLALFGNKCSYVNIDFVPTSLAAAPQVIKQFFPNLKVLSALDVEANNGALELFNYVSLPAWKINLILGQKFDLGINTHSCQEMEPQTFKFYVENFAKFLATGKPLYFVNNPPDSFEQRGVARYKPHSFYGLEKYFIEKKSKVNTFTDDWEDICGIPSLERILERS